MRKIKTLTLFLLLSTLLFGCHKTAKKGALPPLRVECAEATSAIACDQIWFATSTKPLYEVTIEPRINGYLSSINFESGKPVRRGDLIFRIDPEQLNTSLYAAEATLASAQANLIEARNNYLRAVPLARINAISQTSLDSYTANHIAAEADLKSAEQTLRNAQLNSSYATITSPIDGIIADTPSNEGDYVGPGTEFTTLTTITNIDTLRVELAIPTSTYYRYIDNTESYDNSQLLSSIRLILPDSTEYPHPAIYDYTAQSASSGSSQIIIVAKLPNPNSMLKSNIFARLRANIGSESERILIPQRAITQLQGINSVWIIQPDSSVTYRRVELGNTYGDRWHIKSGIKEGEMVATTALLKLHEGAKVIPTTNNK